MKEVLGMRNEDVERLIAYDLNEQQPDEDAWRRVAMGELDTDALVAERRGVESAAELERKRKLFAPQDEQARARMRDALRERFYSSPPGVEPASHDPSVVSVDGGRRRRARKRMPTTAWGGLLAVAAALVLMWTIGRPHHPTSLSEGSEPLVSYEIRLMDPWSGNMRSSSAGATEPGRCAATYHRERSISVRLHPRRTTHEEVAVATLARSDVGESKWWPAAPPQKGVDGVLTIHRPVADLGLAPGVWTLTFFVTRAGERPDLDALKELVPGSHPGVTVVETTVCIEG